MVESKKMSFFKEISKYAKQICASCLLFIAFFLFACRMIIVGASLLDMEIRIGQDFATTSRLVTSHSAGYFVGAIIVSLQDRHLNDFLTMGIGTSVAGAAIMVIPFLYNFYAMVFASFLNGLGNSVFDLKVHIALTNLWGPDKVGNSIQILHMFYGIGALLCPAFVRIFLLPIPDEMMDDYEAYKNLYKPEDVQITCPFFVFGAPSFLLGFCFLYYYFRNPYSAENQEHGGHGTGHKSIEAGSTDDISSGYSIHSKWKIYLAIFWVAAMAHLVFAVAGMTCSYIQAFGVKSTLRMDKKDAALVATVFWTSFTLTRALFVALTMFVSEQLVVNVCLLMMVGSVVLLFGFITTSPICIWLTAVLLGAGHSPIFPFAYSFIAKYFHLTGQHTSLIFLSGVIGDSFHTALSGTLIDRDPMIFAYHIGTIVAGFTLLSFTLPHVCRKLFGGTPKFNPDLASKRRSRIGSIMMPPMTRSNSEI